MSSNHKHVGEDTFLATAVSDDGPYVEILNMRSAIADEDGEYLVDGVPALETMTVPQARALAAAINKTCDDVEVILSLC